MPDCTRCASKTCKTRNAGVDLVSVPGCDSYEEPKCKNEYQDGCSGEVEYRMNPYTWKSWGAMCDKHFEERWLLEQGVTERYGVNSSVPPQGFDPLDAGEAW